MESAANKRKHDEAEGAGGDERTANSRGTGAGSVAHASITMASPAGKRSFIADSPVGSPMKGIEESPVRRGWQLPLQHSSKLIQTQKQTVSADKSKSARTLFGAAAAASPLSKPSLFLGARSQQPASWDDFDQPEKQIKKPSATTPKPSQPKAPVPAFGSSSAFGATSAPPPTSFASLATSSASNAFATPAPAAATSAAATPAMQEKSGVEKEKNPFGSVAFGDAGRTSFSFGSGSFGSFASLADVAGPKKDGAKPDSTANKEAPVVDRKGNVQDAVKPIEEESAQVGFGGRETETIGRSDSLKQNVPVKAASLNSLHTVESAFGSKASMAADLSFGGAAAKNEDAKSDFESLLKSTRAKSAKESKEDRTGGDDDEEGDDGEVEHEVAIEKRVEMPPIQVKTGEEDESNVVQVRCKLFRMDDNNTWKERGMGNLRLNCDETTASARLVMRAEGVLRLILNVRVLPGMPCQIVQEKYVQFACCEEAGDRLTRFLVKTGNAAAAMKLYNHIRVFSETS
ncbi:hypothetical protein BC830DRAFT_349440 [Chytriomyces sp. MP71]|nr:hypothetical protein BC830DRAFT_349440 [Chytriomyces sp. MP71]